MTKLGSILANSAKAIDVPIGVIIVKENTLISAGFNTRELSKLIGHAEIEAISRAKQKPRLLAPK